jgi:lipopolysaccharide export system protein LptA
MIGTSKTKYASLLLIVSMALTMPLQAMAQAEAPPSGPIDIQAAEQEFAGDHIIARGNVRVVYKDSVIVAPVATLYRDAASGQPQKAIFTGHPHLVQGHNKIDADTLVFEMVTSKIVADGHAHSEVINESNDAPTTVAATSTGAPLKKGAKAATAEQALAQAAANKGPLQTDRGDIDESTLEKPAVTASSSTTAGAANSASTGAAKGGAMGDEAPTSIITDSDRQEYDRGTGKFEAFGKVKVKAGDINVLADHLRMAYGIDNRPEAAIFNGHVSATQGTNNTQSDSMTYFLNTKRLQATGHVRSKVIQAQGAPAKEAPKPAEGKVEQIVNSGPKSGSGSDKNVGFAPLLNTDPSSTESQAPIIIVSDTQDYNKETGRLDAAGNVKIFYNDTIGIGPKVILVRNADGQAEKVLFIGRSQITQPGKRWIGDKITMRVTDRKVLAEGNTRAFILQKPSGPVYENGVRFAVKKAPLTASSGELQVSTSKVDRPE